jgi:hypothetical protein
LPSIWGGRRLHDPENPPLNLGGLALGRFKLGEEELFKAPISVRQPQPFGCCVCVLLVGASTCARESPAPQRRIDLSDYGAVGRHAPAVEGPKVNAVFDLPPDVTKPRNPSVRGLRHGPPNVEMEDRLGSYWHFGHPPPAGIARAGCSACCFRQDYFEACSLA